ncbi:MFS transporter [Actinoplanes lobatus]|uniref:EmrB/QacA subfamily drug resistance transporter n=1 Tax=Actinoplanes lobatus TaxID=113568 RepID=A0A7W7HJF2_9ACTN|nr:MDR family MFS transporter [Actinoplanes lobatus]MBB4751647.1 EmrB/QacA subfamily drug resistance transporter [Actinoplanes lobatus]GGN65121.1 MFS transporter [Actinoplanes lobatus]GIE43231.1 MFS transporter [Actinoplanes lobatus]
MSNTALADAPTAPVLSKRQINTIFVAVLLGILLAALDQTIVATALPTIVADLGGAAHLSWVVTAYLLADTVAVVLAGKFGDLFGRKLVFQVSTVIFVGGSALCGLAGNMLFLIGARAIQGAGAGGLMVTAMALIADVIPLRDRGRYQGALGAVFGVTTVIGPTLGGLFTDHLSWRWAFYINVPIAIVVFIMAARTLPSLRAPGRPIIDYLGIALVASGTTAMILAISWGGNEYAWSSPVIIGLFIASALLLAGFVAVELHAREPMLPMRLFANSVFSVCSVLSFIVGFAMLGAMTFLPIYLQYVKGVSATGSGIRTLPMVIGLFTTSILSGSVVGRTGRYRAFPIIGTAVMAVGLYLMSTMDHATSVWIESVFMLVLGLGIGLSMQVLTIVVQNTVPYTDLGTATSGVTFFRTLGSAFGTAIFGTLYGNHLASELAGVLAGAPAGAAAAAQDPQLLHQLPPAQAAPIIAAYESSIQHVFRWVVPVALLGFVVAWFLKEVPLRGSARAAASDVGDGFSAPTSADRIDQLEREVSDIMHQAGARLVLEHVLASTGGTLTAAQVWALHQTHLHTSTRGRAELPAIARVYRLPREVIQPAFSELCQAGYADQTDGTIHLTPAGQEQLDRVQHAWRQWLDAHLDDITMTDPDDRALVDQALTNIASRLLNESAADPSDQG